MFLVGLLLSNLTLWGQFNQTNSPKSEKQHHVYLVADPAGSGHFSRDVDFTASEGEEIFLFTYPSGAYRFEAWEKDGKILSTDRNISFVMGNSDVTLKAKFVFGPDNPPEPTIRHQLFVESDPIGVGDFDFTSGEFLSEGESIWLRVRRAVEGYQFVHWCRLTDSGEEEIVSTSSFFDYIMGNKRTTLKAKFVYNPNNPPEPTIRHQLFIESDPIGAGTFNISSGALWNEGERVLLSAYGNNGYQFVHWYRLTNSGEDEIVSTNSSFSYTMGDKSATFKAKFVYNPVNPDEPSQPNEKYYYLQGRSYSVQQGSSCNVPIYLINSGNVSGAAFDMVLDKGISIDQKNIKLGERCKEGHTLQIIENEGGGTRFVITGEQSMEGTGGIILYIPLIVSSELTPGTYPIRFSNAVVTLPNQTEKPLTAYESYLHVTRAPRRMGIEDYAALCDMYRAMDGPHWHGPWNIDSDLIDDVNWRGVTFNGNHVEVIDLSGRNVKGRLPASILSLPTLGRLDLSSNLLDWDVQDLADTLLKHSVTPALTQVRLNSNRLRGDVSVLAEAFPTLQELNISSNCFSELSKPLSANVTNLNISYQELPVDIQVVRLATNQLLELPSIFRYKHAERGYKPVSSLTAFSDDQKYTNGYLTYSSGVYSMRWDEWKAPSGSRFLLTATTGDAHGSTLPWEITYDKGDANADVAIDILDVQSTLNYIIQQRFFPFVYAAADIYEDTKITVQDIVLIVNLILDAPIPEKYQAIVSSSRISSPVRLCVEEGKLVIYNDIEVASGDIVLRNCSQSQLRMMLNVNQFQTVAKRVSDGVRLVFFSSSGSTLPIGRTVIAELASKETSVAFADLSDKQAQRIPFSMVPTGISSVTSDAVFAYASGDKIFAVFPDGVKRLTVQVLKPDGSLVSAGLREAPVGCVQLASDLCTGIYLLQLRMEINGEIRNKNVKVVISK